MKTLALIEKYFRIIEQSNQPLDATEPNTPQPDQAAAPVNTKPTEEVPPPEEELKDIPGSGEQYLICLAIKSFAHTPTNEQKKWLDNIRKTYRNSNPKKIAAEIAPKVGLTEEEFKKFYVAPKPNQKVIPFWPEREKMLIDIIIRAFQHKPEDNELSIIDTTRQEYGESDLSQITSIIQELLDGGKEEFTAELDNVPNL